MDESEGSESEPKSEAIQTEIPISEGFGNEGNFVFFICVFKIYFNDFLFRFQSTNRL